MSRISVVGVVAGALLIVGGGAVRAADEDRAAQAAPAVVQPPAPRQQTEAEKLREEMRARLTGTEWTLQLRPLEGTGKTKQDKVSFTGGVVTSERMEKLGYGASNYSLNVKEDRTATWETMQTKAGAGVAFWRGELEGEVMRGILSQQPANGPAENYSFNGKQTGGEAPKHAAPAPVEQTAPDQAAPASAIPEAEPAPAPSAQPEAAVSAPEPAPAPAAAQPKPAPAPAPEAPKKKKGWLW